MIRIAVSVEGATEREFVTRVLVPHFQPSQKYLTPIDIRGNVSLDRICKHAGLDKIRAACPRFNNWITQLEQFKLP